MLCFAIVPDRKFSNFFWKSEQFSEKSIHITDSEIPRIIESVRLNKLEETQLFVDFSEAFDSIHRWKIKQILLAYDISKETVAAIMMLYRNTKVKVHSLDGDTDFFDIVAEVLHGDT